MWHESLLDPGGDGASTSGPVAWQGNDELGEFAELSFDIDPTAMFTRNWLVDFGPIRDLGEARALQQPAMRRVRTRDNALA